MADEGTESQVSAAEIARLAGVGRAAVSNWRRRFDSFPAPTGGTTTSPTFNLAAVERWLREHGKLRDVAPDYRVWHSLQAMRSRHDVTDSVVLAGVALRAADAGVPADADIAQLKAALPDHDTERVSDDEWPVIQRIRAAFGDDVDDAATLFEKLYERYVHASSRSLAVTPEPLTSLMLDLLEPVDGTVYDPACGTASTLRTALLRHPGIRAVGQEIDEGLAHVAATRLAFAAGNGPAPHVATGDSLYDDAWPELLADVAVCNPPFAQRDWGSEDLAYDSRWEYGLPPRSESELAWVQHLLAHVKPGGRVVILMPPASGARRSGRRIRAELLRRGALQAVIGLPAGASPPSGIPLTLWVLRRPDEEAATSDVLLVDGSGRRDRRRNRVDWPGLNEIIMPAWHDFVAGNDVSSEHATVVSVIDLLDDDVNLTPAVHILPSASPVDIDDIRATRDALHDEVTWLASALPDVVEQPSATSTAAVSIGDLVRSGAVELIHHLGRVAHDSDDIGDDGVPVLSGRDVVTGSEPQRRVSLADAASMPDLRPGDVVVVAVSERIRTQVIADDGIVLGPGLYALRPDPAMLDGWFLAGCLRATANERFSSMLGTTLRIDVRRFEVPRIPLADQQELGKSFRELADVEAALTAVARTGNDLVAQVTEGLASGTLRVSP